MLKMLLLCFEPKPLLMNGPQALVCFHAKAQSPSPLGAGGTVFGVITFGTTNPLLGHNGSKFTLSLISAPWLCAPGIQG